jgi:hypothetical protein
VGIQFGFGKQDAEQVLFLGLDTSHDLQPLFAIAQIP